MSDVFNDKPGIIFWITSGAALVWNLFGLSIYVMQVSASSTELSAAYTVGQVAFIEATPVWAISAFAIAVTAGVLGCMSLLFGKAWAVPLFVVSLLSMFIQNVNSYVLNDAVALFGPTPAIIQAVVITIGTALIWYARRARERGWIS